MFFSSIDCNYKPLSKTKNFINDEIIDENTAESKWVYAKQFLELKLNEDIHYRNQEEKSQFLLALFFMSMLSHEELLSDERLQQLKSEIRELFHNSSFIDEQLSQLNSELVSKLHFR